MDNETNNQISQLIAYNGNNVAFRQSQITFTFDSNKRTIEDLIQITSSDNTRSYADYDINMITLGVSGKANDGSDINYIFNSDSFPSIARQLTSFYETFITNTNDDYIRSSESRLRYRDYNKNSQGYLDKPNEIFISIYFGANAAKSSSFNSKVKNNVQKDLETEIEFEDIPNFQDFINTLQQSDQTKDNYKKYFANLEEEKAQEEEAKKQDTTQPQSEPEPPKAPKKTRAKKTTTPTQPTRIQPKRKARFTGKYGKGIDFSKINNHLLQLTSYTGNNTLYNLGQQIKNKIENLRHYAAVHR